MCINIFRENAFSVSTPVGLTTADVNADGFLDLIETTGSSAGVAVQLGNGAGGFGSLGTFAAGANAGAVVAADINGDGRPDLLVGSTGSQSRTISLLLNNGHGFNAPQAIPVGAGPRGLGAADLNGDGKADAVVANRDDSSVSVLLNTGSALGPSAVYGLSATADMLALADINGDGRRDVVVGSVLPGPLGLPGGLAFSVLVNDGTGKMQAPVVTSLSGIAGSSMAVADLNRDGRADIVFNNSFGANIGVLLGLGNGAFQSPSYLWNGPVVPGTPGSLTLTDFDRDGWLDILFTTNGASDLRIARGLGGGSFEQPISLGIPGGTVSSLATGDFNGDGSVDVAAGNTSGSAVTPLINVSNPVQPGILQVADTAIAVEAGGVLNGTAGSDPSGNVLANDTGNGLSVASVAYASGAGGGQPGSLGVPLQGAFGSLTLQANGSFSYIVDQAKSQSLAQGSTATDVFAYTVKDALGAKATAMLSVAVQGRNDAPVAPVLPDVTVLSGAFNFNSWSFTPAGFTDPDSSFLNYSAQLAGGGPLPSFVFLSPSTRQFSSGGPGVGSMPVRLTGTDPLGASASAVFTLNVVSQTFSIAATPAARAEGNAGPAPFQFLVTRAGDTSAAASVAWSVAGSGLTPASAADFTGGMLPAGIATFAAGEMSRTITVNVSGDTVAENGEGFAVTLAPVTANSGLATATARATIVDDDATAPVANRMLFAAAAPQSGYELWVTDGNLAGSKMVADINPGPRGSYPQGFRTSDMAAFGNGVLFNANDGVRGRELWFSDGTADGTRMVADAVAAPNSGINPRYMTAVGGRAFFTGFTSSTARELWITDGTAAGTAMVKDINPGYGRASPTNLTAFNGRLLFSAYTASTGRELWISDGTDAGTTMVTEINPGGFSGNPRNLVVLGDTALFAATSPSHGEELWRTDGTAAGTYEVADLNPSGNASPQNLFQFGNQILFSAATGAYGRELAISDGTKAGTRVLADLNPGIASANPGDFARLGGKVVFSASGAAGSELWVTDGTEAGTARIATSPALTGGFKYTTAVGGRLVFSGFSAANGGELWSTDGTAAGTALLADINPGPDGSDPSSLRLMGNRVLFTATDPVNGASLWSTDGTAAGTKRVATPYPGFEPGSQPISRGSGLPGPRINAVNGRTLFAASDTADNNGNANDRVLWVTTGTSAGTRKLYASTGVPVVLGRAPFQADGLNSYPMITVGNRMLFTAWDSTRGYELWATDGTQAGTNPVSDIFAGTGGSYASNFGTLDSTRALFSARDSTRGYELWVSDGTTAGTSLVKDINVGDSSGHSYPNSFRPFGGKVLFNANDGAHGIELWVTDGTGQGTSLVRDINPTSGAGSLPRNLTVVNNQVLFFAQESDTAPMNLWRTDGTASGTSMVKNVAYTTPRRLSGAMPVVGGKAFFAGDGGSGQQLWMSDGTAAGTAVVAPINPGGSADPTEMVALGSRILFAATDGVHGRELWVTDGTSAGTSMVSDIVAGAGASNPDVLTVLGTKVLFQATDAAHGSELWITDGTAAGTQLLKDIAPGAAGSAPTAISVRNGLAFFQANDGTSGYELWRSDGTTAGTFLVKDIAVDRSGPRPVNLTPFVGPAFTPGKATLDIAAGKAARPEGSSGTTPFTFTVTRSGDTSMPLSASFAVAGAGASPAVAADFAGGLLPAGTLSFAPGETERSITVNVAADTSVESDEGFRVTLGTPSAGVTFGSATASGTILNDDARISIAPLAASGPEGDSGPSARTFTVTRSGDTAVSHTVSFKVAGSGTTPAGAGDFDGGALPGGTVSFAPGQSSSTLTIAVAGDTAVEGNETFAVTLANPSAGATLGTTTATGTIQNDDARISIAALAASKAEGQGGTTALTFTVTRAGNTSIGHSVSFAVAGSGDSPANAADFGGVLPGGTVSFAPGQTSRTVSVGVSGDLQLEADETFTVSLSSPSAGATLGQASAIGTILNDDVAPTGTLSIGRQQASRAEGLVGTTPFTFLVARAGDTSGPAWANWAVTSGGVSGTVNATASDFTGGALPSGIVTFLPGEANKVIKVGVAADIVAELNESFTVTLLGPPVGVGIDKASATGMIWNDDTPGTGQLAITRASAQKPEGQAGSTVFTFTVARSGDVSGTASADWAVTGGGVAATGSANGADFAGGILPSGRVSFTAGQASQTVTVAVAGDGTIELNESFTITLAAPQQGVAIATASATGVILNDDFPPSGVLSIAPLHANRGEGAGGSTAFTFVVTRSGSTAGPAQANWTVTSADADANDFGGALPTGTVSFVPGQVSQVVTVAVAGDTGVEADEGFSVALSGTPAGVTLDVATAVGTIRNDDPGGTGSLAIARTSAQKPEGHDGTTFFTFNVIRSGDISGAAGADWQVSGGGVTGTNSATAADFAVGQFPAGRVSFAPGQASAVVTVNVAADWSAELNESFTVALSNVPTGVAVGIGSATGMILNDDFASTSANQTLNGTAAGDLFLLGGGLDVVFGKGGSDSFRFTPSAIGPASGNATALQDFNRAAGQMLTLSPIDAIAGTLADDAFTFIGTKAFDGTPGQLRWQDQGGGILLIQGNVNTDTTADLTITVKSAGPVDANWFAL